MNHQQNKWKQVWFENRFTRTSQQTSQRETKNVNTKVWFNWKRCALSELPTSGTWYPPPQLVVRQKRAFIIYGIYRPIDIISICHVEYLDISAYQLNKSICIKSKSTCQQALWFNFSGFRVRKSTSKTWHFLPIQTVRRGEPLHFWFKMIGLPHCGK